jgi:cyclopropane fatty-acyl-phospholipid synthase-like methyltransferase
MQKIDKLKESFNAIFFIASFHHLETIEERKEVLKQVYDLLEKDGMIFMTNWALESDFNKEKYISSKIPNSTNEF